MRSVSKTTIIVKELNMQSIILQRITERPGKELRRDWVRILFLWAVSLTLRYVSSLLCVILAVSSSPAQPDVQKPFAGGEILQYKVKWSIFRLGTVVIRQETEGDDDSKMVRVFISAESTLGIPFIDLFFENQALLETETCRSREFISEVGRKDKKRFLHRPIADNRLLLEERTADGISVLDTLHHDVPLYDDPGLFMHLRHAGRSSGTVLIHSVMERSVKTTSVTYEDETVELSVGDSERPLLCRKFRARANWSRPDYAGLRGEFEGWITEDVAAIPVQLEAKIAIGSIRLELESVHRPGWPIPELALDKGDR